MTEKEHGEYWMPIAGIGLLAISFLAFSKKSREAIHKRDKGKSVLSGTSINLSAAHIDHNKKSKLYDHPSNGRLLSLFEHLLDHINRAGRNGLNQNQNNYAIRKIKEKMAKLYSKIGDPK